MNAIHGYIVLGISTLGGIVTLGISWGSDVSDKVSVNSNKIAAMEERKIAIDRRLETIEKNQAISDEKQDKMLALLLELSAKEANND